MDLSRTGSRLSENTRREKYINTGTPDSSNSKESCKSNSTKLESSNSDKVEERQSNTPNCSTTSKESSSLKTSTSDSNCIKPKLLHVSPDPGPDRFSSYHPMIPKRYVPPWQLDMKNRSEILENTQRAGLTTWGGHVSYFLEGRERLNATSYEQYQHLLTSSRDLQRISSPMSKYNSSILYFS